jgi:NitT/TauT family transport system substrate-binding protein
VPRRPSSESQSAHKLPTVGRAGRQHRIALLAVWVLLCIALPARGAVPIKVAGVPIDVGAEAYYALERGFFLQEGLDAEITSASSGPAIAAAVASGAITFGNANFVSLAQAHERGLPFVIVAPAGAYSSDSPTAALIVGKASRIRSAADLDGKTIGVATLRSLSEIVLRAWLERHGGDGRTVRLLEIPYIEMPAALASGRIDAGLVEEPALSQALASGDRILAPAYDVIAKRFLEGAWFCTSDYAGAHPDVVRAFADAIARTARWANANHAASLAILAKYTKIAPSASMHRVYYPERLRVEDVQPLIDAAAKYGVIERRFSARELFAVPP